MAQTFGALALSRSGERGGSRVKFLVVITVLGLVGYALYLYIPVQYEAWLYKDLMQHNVDVASVSGYPTTWVKEQLTKSASEFNVPPDAVINASQAENRVVCTVQFTRPIQFLGFTYEYKFDHTAKSTAFLSIK